jgi:dTDP-4-amino-4,6-dideoxygalactose transaminase
LITPRTKAIGLVHFVGIPCDMHAIMEISTRHGLKVIEDCALAVGARYAGTHVGLFGDAAICSFDPVKHITTGDGGMFVSKHAELADRVAKARAFGVDRTFAERDVPGMYDVPTLGLNYRLSDINAAIGRKQLERIHTILERRRDNFETLRGAIEKVRGLSVLDASSPQSSSSHYCLSIVLDDSIATHRNTIVKALNAAGIGTSVYYPHPVPRLKYYQDKYGYDASRFRHAARISDQSIALPVGPHLVPDDMTYIAKSLIGIMGRYA